MAEKEKILPCSKCGKKFEKKDERTAHYKEFPSHRRFGTPGTAIPGAARPFRCFKCKKTFGGSHGRANHYKEFPNHRDPVKLQMLKTKGQAEFSRGTWGGPRTGTGRPSLPGALARFKGFKKPIRNRNYTEAEKREVLAARAAGMAHKDLIARYHISSGTLWSWSTGMSRTASARAGASSSLPTISSRSPGRPRGHYNKEGTRLRFCTECGVRSGGNWIYCGGCGRKM